MPTICHQCGNNHYGPCATEETCFIWTPEGPQIPKDVLITGSWKKWQTVQKLNQEVNEDGSVYFRINLTLLTGTYEYKYVVDGEWKYDPKSPTMDDQHGSLNNYIKVFPKKMFVPVNKEGKIKISSNLLIQGLKIVGSWDNWTNQIAMQKMTNHLKGCQQYVGYIPVEADKQYEFRFKLKKQWLIDEKYPAITNCFNSHNNVIITYEQEKSDRNQTSSTPIVIRPNRQFTAKNFEWVTISRSFELPYKRVEGHSMSCIGDYVYIFGGYCRSQFYNSLTKLNFQFTISKSEQVWPNGRAFHTMVHYGNKLIVFGGHNKTVLEDYYSFNVTEQKWMAVPNISGKYPTKKQKQSCVIYEMLMVFFGGYYCSPDFQYEEYYKEISVLDIENMKWIDQIQVIGEQPTGRFAHTASLIGSEMFIFGGTYNADENLNLNDIWKINLSKVNQLSWSEIKPKGSKPKPRHGHSMNVLATYLIIFGGLDDDGKYLNDLFVFDISKNQWFQPMISGSVPRPRYYHASAVLPSNEIVVFAGRTKDQRTIENIYLLRPTEFNLPLNIDQNDDQ